MTHADPLPRLPLNLDTAPAAVRTTQDDWDRLTGALLDDGHEQSALLYCGLRTTDAQETFLVRDIEVLNEDDYVDRSALHLSISPITLARAAKRARRNDQHVIVVHSHPFSGKVAASPIDLRTEVDLCGRVLPARTGRNCAAMVIGPGGVDARAWSADGARPITHVDVIGDQRQRIPVTSSGLTHTSTSTSPSTSGSGFRSGSTSGSGSGSGFEPAASSEGHAATSRQELLWGQAGQSILQAAHVAIVGAGGTGSHVASQLAHLRVGHLTVIDHDQLEHSNLSRVIGSTPADVGRAKVDVVADHCTRINPDMTVTAVAESVLDSSPARYVDADVIVCATDAHGSRSLLTEIASQYLVPVVDLGVEVDPSDSTFRAGGGVRVIRPGRGCLWCAGTLDSALVREEYLSDEQRTFERQQGYLRGVDEPAPSVVALNGVVASLAVLEVCQLLVGMLAGGTDRVLYRAEQRRLTTVAMASHDTCHVCGTDGLLALGDARRVPTRRNSSTFETA